MSAKRTRTRRPAGPKTAEQVEQIARVHDVPVNMLEAPTGPEETSAAPALEAPEATAPAEVEQVAEKPAAKRRPAKDPRLCVLGECDRAVLALGLCGAHYASRRGDHA